MAVTLSFLGRTLGCGLGSIEHERDVITVELESGGERFASFGSKALEFPRRLPGQQRFHLARREGFAGDHFPNRAYAF